MKGHLGSRVSALLDGQLPSGEEERCWQHVRACHPCRDLVEREGWVKARLTGLDARAGDAADLPGPLARALRQPDLRGRGSRGVAAAAGAPGGAGDADQPARRGTRATVLALGGAGAGAAALGVALLAFVPGSPDDLRPPVSSLPGDGSSAVGGAGAPQPVLPGHRFVPVRNPAP